MSTLMVGAYRGAYWAASLGSLDPAGPKIQFEYRDTFALSLLITPSDSW